MRSKLEQAAQGQPAQDQPPDERIREDVCQSLTDDPRIDASNINVNVGAGEVTLSGNVLTREEKRLAEDLAERVSGVGAVQNCLTIAADEARRTAR